MSLGFAKGVSVSRAVCLIVGLFYSFPHLRKVESICGG